MLKGMKNISQVELLHLQSWNVHFINNFVVVNKKMRYVEMIQKINYEGYLGLGKLWNS